MACQTASSPSSALGCSASSPGLGLLSTGSKETAGPLWDAARVSNWNASSGRGLLSTGSKDTAGPLWDAAGVAIWDASSGRGLLSTGSKDTVEDRLGAAGGASASGWICRLTLLACKQSRGHGCRHDSSSGDVSHAGAENHGADLTGLRVHMDHLRFPNITPALRQITHDTEADAACAARPGDAQPPQELLSPSA